MSCPIPENLVVHVYLYHATSPTGANAKLVASNYYAHPVSSIGVRTTPSVCGYTGYYNYWTTVADVSFNNGYTWTGYLYSNLWSRWSTGPGPC